MGETGESLAAGAGIGVAAAAVKFAGRAPGRARFVPAGDDRDSDPDGVGREVYAEPRWLVPPDWHEK